MKLHAFLRDEEALTIVEYAVAAGLIVAALAAAFLALGISINTIITSVNAFLTA
jgi:pilus assembly protein Flp/PilA